MKFLVVFALFAVAASKHLLFHSDLDEHWENFKRVYGKKYDGMEEMARRMIWEKNVAHIVSHNLKADMNLYSFTMGINEFSDMETSELMEMFNGARVPDGFLGISNFNGSTWIPPSNIDLPGRVDWREQGLVTRVKNQRNCGSCWAFSATGALEGQHKKKTGRLVSLSEQNLMDCSRPYGTNGCKGGWMNDAFRYVIKNRGIDTESSYPYTAWEGNCRFNRGTVGATCTGYVKLPSGNEAYLKWAVASAGPISVAINIKNSFHKYRNGIYYEPACSTQPDHAVLVVGYGTDGGTDYWLVKNSWGTSWGMSGYVKMIRNRNNNCGIATYASYPLV